MDSSADNRAEHERFSEFIGKREDSKAHRHEWQVRTVQIAVTLNPQSCRDETESTNRHVTGSRLQDSEIEA